MKKWGGANDPNAVPPGNYGDPNASTTVSPVPTPVAPVDPPSKGIWDTFTSYIPGVGSSSIDDKLKANEAERIRLEQEKAAESQTSQGGGRRRKRSHKKRSRRSKRSRRHR